MGKTAYIFPGQGAQVVGMGKDLYQNCPAARDTYNLADEILGYKISELCFEGPLEELTLTKNVQPALLATSIAIFKAAEAANDLPRQTLSPDTAWASIPLWLPEDHLSFGML